MDQKEFAALISTCAEIADYFPDGIVFIGGMAVYLHVIHTPSAATFAEFTHDADFYISLADMSDLRDLEEVTPNRRLSKHQLIKRGFEFDIYTERQSSLIVPYDAVLAHAKVYGNFRVAGLSHLWVLKLEAYKERRQSTKGEKDAKDLFRIALVASTNKSEFDPQLAVPYLHDEHLELLPGIHKSPAVVSMARGNAVVAKQLRNSFRQIMDDLGRRSRN